MADFKDSLSFIINSIVPSGTEISINETQEDGFTVFEISSPTETTGRIIGKEGKTIKSIRNLLNFSFPQTRFILKIKD
jgi:predicted RNA-binding protein YlqC (UPF0109 family)